MKTSVKNNLLRNNLLFLFSVGVILTAIFGCGKIQSFVGTNKLFFCDKYIAESDFCEGEGNKFSVGSLTVMAKLKDPVGTDEVFVNVTDKASGNTVNDFPFTVAPDMMYINFKGVSFISAGSYTVNLVTKEGSVLASNDIEITN